MLFTSSWVQSTRTLYISRLTFKKHQDSNIDNYCIKELLYHLRKTNFHACTNAFTLNNFSIKKSAGYSEQSLNSFAFDI